ncbi:MAG: YdbH domain-containing protein [Proteobacteria bacterium]|nr:YdbH domain-containing protein [Pseudomonadota bacterium]MBU1060876.1 YdbH domain-containing protein [Pseudomonadota bacterium]
MRFFLILTAFLLTISLSLLFINRQTVTEKLLSDKLKAIGCQEVQLTVSELSRNRLTVASLATKFQENSTVHEIKLENVVLNFSLGSLLLGKVAGMSIDLVEVGLEKQGKTSRNTFSYQTVEDLLTPNLLPAYLPKNIFIKSLILSGPSSVPLTGKSLQLEIEILDSGLSVKLGLPEKLINIKTVLTHLSNGATHLQIEGHQGATPLFHFCLQQKHSEATGKLTILVDTLNILSPLLPVSLPDVSGRLELQFSARKTTKNPLEMELLVDGRSLSLPGLLIDSLTGKFALHTDNFETLTFHRGSHFYICDIQSQMANLEKLYFQVSGSLSREQKQLTLALNNASRLIIEELNTKSFRIEHAEVTPALSVGPGPLGTTFVLDPDFTTVIKALHINKLNVPQLQLSPEQKLAFTVPADPTAGWKVGSGIVMADINALQFEDLHIQPTRLTLEIEDPKNMPSPSQLQALIRNRAMSVQWKDINIPLQDIQVALRADHHNLELSTTFSHATIPGRIEGSAAHNLETGAGTARFSTVNPFDLQGGQAAFNQLVTGFSLPFSLSSGLVDSTVTMEWDKGQPLIINSKVQLADGIGIYKDIGFTGIQLEQNLQLLPQLRSLNPGNIFISELDTMLKIKDITLSNQISPGSTKAFPILLADSIEAKVLGGRISSKNIHLDPSHPELNCILQVDGVNVTEIINLNKIDGLSVTGLLDGNISVHIQDRRIQTAKGELKSRAPGGIISYHRAAGDNGTFQQLPQYAIHALEEFHYNTLTTTPLYEPDGTLTIAIHTEGRSPKVNTNRPIHLNLNTSQNLLSLLQSLRYTKNLTDDLENQLHSNQSKK